MSRLLDNSDRFRENLESRNLFTPEDPYEIDNGKLVDTVNAIASLVSPFSSFDLSNTIIGRLMAINGPITPIAQIGLSMIGRQFAATAASNGAAEFLPTINFSNIFDGDPTTKFFMTKVDFQITRRNSQSTIGRILEEISGTIPPNSNPFTPDSTASDYILNTGKGQLEILFTNVNKNIYKKSDKPYIDTLQEEDIQLFTGSEIISIKTFFSGQDQNFYPFTRYKLEFADIANANMRAAEIALRPSNATGENKDRYLEYGATQEYIDLLGKTIIRDNNDGSSNFNINPNDFGLQDDATQQLVWGRDGITNEFRNQSEGFDRIFEGDTPNNGRFSFANQSSNLNINGGILKYTQELLNAQGKYNSFDLTRKKYIDRDEQLHFKGSPLTQRPDGTIDRSRQHNIADPYNNFAKAIRFNGNIMYGGNQNSTIYNSVVPKFHSIVDKNGNINNKNVMFSIENLAAIVIKDDVKKIGYLDDEFGTEIPLCEVGQQNGRVMWFPPYDINLSEQAIARHETTTFLGRGEPIYTYSHSERLATLSFKLLIDYPPQVIGRDQQNASEFFAFGDSGDTRTISNFNIGDKEAQKQDLIEQRDAIQPTVVQADPQLPYPITINYYFPNNFPTIGNENGAIDESISLGYENGITNPSEIDGRDLGLNASFVESMDAQIIEFLSEENREFVRADIVGSATRLFLGENQAAFNQALGQRRAEALKDYISERYKVLFNTSRTPEQDGVQFNLTSIGSIQATDDTATVASIPTFDAKSFRNAGVTFVHNGNTQIVTRPITPEEERNKQALDAEIRSLDNQINQARKRAIKDQTCVFNIYTIEDGILKGFQSFDRTVNKFQPVFHSQTPEDFHRRLTFLHQCTRQGNPVRRFQETSDGITTFSSKNAVFGRQPVCILRVGDFFHTKVVIDNINFDYTEAPWDLNPEGMGMQFMIADITIQMKVIGGQSLKAPIDALQNAVSFNYYGNSTFFNTGVYKTATEVESRQIEVNEGIVSETQANVVDRNSIIAQNLTNGQA